MGVLLPHAFAEYDNHGEQRIRCVCGAVLLGEAALRAHIENPEHPAFVPDDVKPLGMVRVHRYGENACYDVIYPGVTECGPVDRMFRIVQTGKTIWVAVQSDLTFTYEEG